MVYTHKNPNTNEHHVYKGDIVELTRDINGLKVGKYIVASHSYLAFTIKGVLNEEGVTFIAFSQPRVSLAAFKHNFKCELLTNSKELYL